MKLVVGLGSPDDLTAYAAAGADEVFIGYVPLRWQEKYGLTTPLNRREVCFYNVQIGSFSELELVSELAGKSGVKVTVAFNGLHFREDQYPVIASIMEECLSVGISDVIIADFGLLLYLDRIGLNRKLAIHISGEFGEINYYMVKELAALGAKRIIFHRKVSLENMERMIRACRADKDMEKDMEEGMEFEAFLLNENCHFNGAFCNSLHCDELVPMCRMPYRLGGEAADKQIYANPSKEAQVTDTANNVENPLEASSFNYDYGLKNLVKMKEIGITHLKIVGRGADSQYMIECIQWGRRLLSPTDLPPAAPTDAWR